MGGSRKETTPMRSAAKTGSPTTARQRRSNIVAISMMLRSRWGAPRATGNSRSGSAPRGLGEPDATSLNGCPPASALVAGHVVELPVPRHEPVDALAHGRGRLEAGSAVQ